MVIYIIHIFIADNPNTCRPTIYRDNQIIAILNFLSTIFFTLITVE